MTREKQVLIARLVFTRIVLLGAATDIRKYCAENRHIHATELEGAARMIDDWIENIQQEDI
jgi:hypothetical protein